MGPRCQLWWAIRSIARTFTIALAVVHLTPPDAARAEAYADLGNLSIEALMEVEVTSVSKHAQPLSEAAAAVYVLTGEQIRRSGLTSIPEALRLVPGLAVARIDANKWAITSRGFNSQFANKLLVLIDGRSVYTPLFSGVFWDVQDVPLEDLDRIEVVRGPGGTLWGANAVNGVINIITKSAKDTQGVLASGGAGSHEDGFGTLRYGRAIGEDAAVRGYVKYFDRDDFDTVSGTTAHDGWDQIRGGFRLDWDVSPHDVLTLQGDYYDGNSDSTLLTGLDIDDSLSGGNFLAHWTRTFSETSDLDLKFYYDRTERDLLPNLIDDKLDTVDVEFQHRFRVSDWHDLIWGAGYRLYVDDVDNSVLVTFDPDDRTDHLGSAFFQNEFRFLDDSLHVIVGSKFEHNDYTGFEAQPNVRALWRPDDRQSVWAAISRAVRTPSRADEHVSFLTFNPSPPPPFALIQGNSSFKSEELLAFEVGYRAQPLERVSIDIAAYYNIYDHLRSVETLGVMGPIAVQQLENRFDADTYGVEVTTTWKPTDYWELTGWYTLMEVDVDPDNNSNDPTSKGQEDDTPTHQFQIRSRLNLPYEVEFDTTLYWVDKLSSQGVSSYTRFDARLGWRPFENLELSLVGQNLSDKRNQEFGDGFFSLASKVPRSVYGKVTWRY